MTPLFLLIGSTAAFLALALAHLVDTLHLQVPTSLKLYAGLVFTMAVLPALHMSLTRLSAPGASIAMFLTWGAAQASVAVLRHLASRAAPTR